MFKLGMFEAIEAEMEGLGDLNKLDTYFEYSHSSPSRKGWLQLNFLIQSHTYICWYGLLLIGSMMPYSLRLLHAELRMYSSNQKLKGALESIYRLKAQTSKV